MSPKNRKRNKTKTSRGLRASITFPPELYSTIEDLAKRKKVSIAWVVREATEKYVAEQWPLFSQHTREKQ
jgi:predicted DNA-binding protein